MYRTCEYHSGMSKNMIYEERRRLFKLLIRNYKNQTEAAEALGLKSAIQVSHIVTGAKNMGEQIARTVERNAGLDEGFLLSPFSKNVDIENIELSSPSHGSIPLITYEQAGKWMAGIDVVNRSKFSTFFSTTKQHSPDSYALRVVGDSMWNKSGRPSYYDGDIIIVDPHKSADAVNTDRVIALLDDVTLPMIRRVTFKQLIIDGPQQYLRSLNESYSPIHDSFTVLGLVINVIAE